MNVPLEYDESYLVAMYKAMADAQPALLWASDTTGACTHFNATWLAFRGRSEELERGEGWFEGVHPDDKQYCMSVYLDAFARQERFEMEYRLQRHDGVDRWILDIGAPWALPDGAFAGYIGVCFDVTEHRERLARIEDDRDGLASTLDALPTAVVAIDSSGKVTGGNDAAVALFDAAGGSLVGADAASLADSFLDRGGRRQEDAAAADQLPADSPERWSGEHGLTTDGQVRWFTVSATCVPGVDGVAASTVVTFTDVTQHHLVERILTLEAHQDPLTGLANRRALFERLEDMWNAPEGIVVMMVDVDHFKSINDSYGHAVGDEVLTAVARRLRASVRPDDVVARLGGDEFALVCSADSGHSALRARVVSEFASAVSTTAGPIQVRVSVGVADSKAGDTPGDLLRKADQSMYRHKRQARAASQ
ncbi:MAG: diguanylate cyclase [Acidimicrobiales bacterium]